MSPDLFSALRDQIEATATRLGIPGVGFGVITNGTPMADGYGVTNVNHPLPVDADTLFQIGSISKTFTGTAAMRLVEQGRLELDTPICTYLPTLRLRDAQTTAAITMRHCLTHLSGFVGDLFSDTGWGDDALARYVDEMADLEQFAPLGTLWSYCNSGFGLAARVIEVITGKPVEQAITELVFQPLGLDRAFFFPWDVMTYGFAVGHRAGEDRPQVLRPWPIPRSASAVGAISTSVRQLLSYAAMHLKPDPALAPMQIAQAEAGNFADQVGITWMLRDHAGVTVVSHGGATNGQMAQLALVPSHGFAIALLTNADRGRALNLEVVNWALAAFLGIKEPAPARLDRSIEALAAYTGRYQAHLDHLEVRIVDGMLQIQSNPQGGFPDKSSPPGPTPPPVRAAWIGDERLLILDAPFANNRAEFIRDEHGRVAWLRFGGRVHRRV